MGNKKQNGIKKQEKKRYRLALMTLKLGMNYIIPMKTKNNQKKETKTTKLARKRNKKRQDSKKRSK